MRYPKKLRIPQTCDCPGCDRPPVLTERVDLTHGEVFLFCSRDCRERWQMQDTREDVHWRKAQKRRQKPQHF